MSVKPLSPTAGPSRIAAHDDAASTSSPFASAKAALLEAIAPGRGNSHWLSFSKAQDVLATAEGLPPGDQDQMRQLLADGLRTGAIEGRALVVGARALKRLAEFTGVDPQVYLEAAPRQAKLTGAARRLGASGFDAGGPAPSIPADRTSPAAALGQSVAGGVQKIAAAIQAAPPTGAIVDVDSGNAKATAVLAQHLADRGLSPENVQVDIKLDRAMWDPKDFENQAGLDDALRSAAGFLAQLAEDGGGAAKLTVSLTPRGKLTRTAGTDGDTLWVPANGGRDALELRQDWDAGVFLRPDAWWNPMDRVKTKKLRAMWKLVGNPVSTVRTRLRAVLGDSRGKLLDGIRGTLDRVATLGEDGLRTSVEQLVRGHVAPDAKSQGGGSFLQDLLDRVASADQEQLVSLLSRWGEVASDDALLEDVGSFATQATANRLRDSTFKIGLVNVDTYDTVSVSPDSALSRHGGPAMNDVELDGVRVGLVNVSSVDMVTVEADLARMIFGGTSLEKAAATLGLA